MNHSSISASDYHRGADNLQSNCGMPVTYLLLLGRIAVLRT